MLSATLAAKPVPCKPVPSFARPARLSRWPARRTTRLQTLTRSAQHSNSDTDVDSADFSTLAKEAAGRLASNFTNSSVDKLQRWLLQGKDEPTEHARTDQSPLVQSAASRLTDLASEVTGLNGFKLEDIKAWLGNPKQAEEKHDTQMVSAILAKLLHQYEKQVGRPFELKDFEKLYSLARSVLGDSITKRMLKALIKSYLGVHL